MSDPAVGRFFVLQAVRLSGAIVLLLGVMIGTGRAPTFLAELPQEAGYVLAALGLFEFFFVPRLLARKWKTPDGQ